MSKNYYNCEPENNSNCDCNHSNKHNCNCNEDSSYVIGNSVKFCINEFDNEIKADVTVNTRNTVRVWGQIIDCNGKPVPYAYVKLAKVCGNSLEGVAHTITDCLGYYQFDVCPSIEGFEFTLIVGKASVGSERVISTGTEGTACNPYVAPNCPSCNQCNHHSCKY
ncbi:hypothetical protein SAMN02745163_02031 [Clostridium cavendishii DSM 21758]|uniref:Uncharacterized protein n=1 Tax=Clostridium cavendishii DSM 21758 TaxID=1121302 RepID=A0A1M6JH93_9CLOT|nr:hypothetical protein [Clostridium cavendishii]SHJ46041.1 hypothetical protein SAMN02745163_02031 [Clostridium cavendishii DSM 21758]